MSQIIDEFERMVEDEELDEPFEEDAEEPEPLNLAPNNRGDQPPPKRRRRLTIDDYTKEDSEATTESHEARHVRRTDKIVDFRPESTTVTISDTAEQWCFATRTFTDRVASTHTPYMRGTYEKN
jgi:hypothetical protein